MRLSGGNPGGAAWKRLEGRRKEARGRAGRLVPSHLRVRPLWASELRGLAEERCVCARGPCVCTATPGAAGSFMFDGGTTPLLCPMNYPLDLALYPEAPLPYSGPRREFC